jgi:hypothetical protein
MRLEWFLWLNAWTRDATPDQAILSPNWMAGPDASQLIIALVAMRESHTRSKCEYKIILTCA